MRICNAGLTNLDSEATEVLSENEIKAMMNRNFPDPKKR